MHLCGGFYTEKLEGEQGDCTFISFVGGLLGMLEDCYRKRSVLTFYCRTNPGGYFCLSDLEQENQHNR